MKRYRLPVDTDSAFVLPDDAGDYVLHSEAQARIDNLRGALETIAAQGEGESPTSRQEGGK